MTKNRSIDMTEGTLWNKILIFSIPFMLTNILQLLYNAADVVVVGRYAGQTALAAVGTTGSLSGLLTNLFIGISGGVSVAMARSFGAKDDKAMHEVVHTAISVSLIAGIFLTVVGVIFAPFLLKLISVPDDILPQASSYMRMIFAGMIPSMLYNFGSGILRAKGDTKRPLIIISISGIINVILNLWFVISFKMGAAGVGLATTISQCFSAFFIIRILRHENDSSKLSLWKLKVYKKRLSFILKIGIPNGLQSCIFAFSNILFQSSVNSFGSATIAGCAAAGNIEGFMYTALNTFAQAAMTFVSQNIGARKHDRIDKTIKWCLTYVTIMGMIVTVVSVFLGKALLSIYAPDDFEVIKIGYTRLFIIGSSYLLCGIMDTFNGALRGMGASLSGLIVSIIGVCGIRIVWILVVFPFFRTLEMLFVCYPISWGFTALLFIFFYIHERKKFA